MRAFALGLVACTLAVGDVGHAADPFLRRTAAVEVVERAGPAVVNVTTERIVRQPVSPFGSLFSGDPFFDQFFRDFSEPRARTRTVQSLGSGVLIDAERHVLTNAHVIARASRIRVTLADGREFDATLIGADPNNDLAVLRVDTEEALPWIPPGTSSDLMAGEPVIAIGNPFGLSNTVTTGVISAIDRSVHSDDRVFHGFLQTDASINPGNSGGPLLNALGELVAVNTAIYNGAQGIGFAIPIDVARRVVQELIAHGEVAPVWLGIDLQDLGPELREVMKVPGTLQGALVGHVRSGGPAAQAGVLRGDVVTGFEGHPVASAREFYDALDRVTTGQEIRLVLWREGLALERRMRAAALPEGVIQELAEQKLGVRLRKEPSGFQVEWVRVGSGAERIGIQRGDLVLRLNGLALQDDESLRRSVLDLRGRSRALLVVQRGAGRYHVTLPLS